MTSSKPQNLEKRTLIFSKQLINYLKALKLDAFNRVIINQVIRSGTSIGANYREANETETKKDFKYKIRLSRKEAKETVYWIDLLIDLHDDNKLKYLRDEAYQLLKIFAAISYK